MGINGKEHGNYHSSLGFTLVSSLPHLGVSVPQVPHILSTSFCFVSMV